METQISIVIPTFNQGDLISYTIDSIKQQCFENWEVIIIDDGSTDETSAIVKMYSEADDRITYCVRDREPKGGSVCRNIGASKARGKYLIFLDSDDLLINTCLQNRFDFMESRQSLDFSVFKMQEFFEFPGDSTKLAMNFEVQDHLSAFLDNNYPYPWTITCPIWDKTFFLDIGGFDESYLRLQDPEFHTRVLLSCNIQFEICYDSSPDCFYRQNAKKKITEEHLLRIVKSLSHYTSKIAPLVKEYDLKNGTKYSLDLKRMLIKSTSRLRLGKYMWNDYKNMIESARKNYILNFLEYYYVKTYIYVKLTTYGFLYKMLVKIGMR